MGKLLLSKLTQNMHIRRIVVVLPLLVFLNKLFLKINDNILSLTLASMMSFSAWGLVNKAAKILLRETPKFIDNDRLKTTMKKVGTH